MERELVGKVEEVVVKVGDVVDRVEGTLDRVDEKYGNEEVEVEVEDTELGIADALKAEKVSQDILDLLEENKRFKESMGTRVEDLRVAEDLVWLGIIKHTKLGVVVKSLVLPTSLSAKLQESLKDYVLENANDNFNKTEGVRFLELSDFANVEVMGNELYSTLEGDEDKRGLPIVATAISDNEVLEVLRSDIFQESLDEDEANFVKLMTDLTGIYLDQVETLVHKLKLQGIHAPEDFVVRNEGMSREDLLDALYYYDKVITNANRH